MRCYTKQHKAQCGIALHARRMDVCILNQDGALLLHRPMKTRPEMVRKAIAPQRADLVVAVEGLCTGYWLAALCAQDHIPFGLGHALSMQALHGGKAHNDQSDAQKIAVRLRGGMLPQAYGDPAEMRAPRDWLRRRFPLTRQRAELLAHVQQTTSQDNRPELGNKWAYQANRDGGAERFPDPAVQQSVAGDLALLAQEDQLLRDVEWPIVRTAKEHNAQALQRLQSGPGIGKIWRFVLLYDTHAIHRFPRVQDCVSSCRLVQWAKESAGTRSGTSGAKMGPTHRQWAFSAAAVLCLRNHPPAQTQLARLEHTHGKGQAFPSVAHP